MTSKSPGLTLLEAHNFNRWAAKIPDQLLSHFPQRNIDRDVQQPPGRLIHALLIFLAGKYGLFEANTTLIRPTPRRKGRIRPFYVNTAHSISSAYRYRYQTEH